MVLQGRDVGGRGLRELGALRSDRGPWLRRAEACESGPLIETSRPSMLAVRKTSPSGEHASRPAGEDERQERRAPDEDARGQSGREAQE